MTTKTRMLDELRMMLHDAFEARHTGGPHAHLARAHGYADGYMRAMLDSGVASQRELLRLVGEQRRRVRGEAVGELTAEALA